MLWPHGVGERRRRRYLVRRQRVGNAWKCRDAPLLCYVLGIVCTGRGGRSAGEEMFMIQFGGVVTWCGEAQRGKPLI